MPSSIREVKRFTSLNAYRIIKPQMVKRDWEIVAMTSDYIVLRIERCNYKFSRSSGKTLEIFRLPPKKEH